MLWFAVFCWRHCSKSVYGCYNDLAKQLFHGILHYSKVVAVGWKESIPLYVYWHLTENLRQILENSFNEVFTWKAVILPWILDFPQSGSRLRCSRVEVSAIQNLLKCYPVNKILQIGDARRFRFWVHLLLKSGYTVYWMVVEILGYVFAGNIMEENWFFFRLLL